MRRWKTGLGKGGNGHRSARGGLLLLTLWLVAAFLPRAGALTAGLGLTLATSPEGPAVDAVTVHVPVDADGVSTPLFLRQEGTSPLEGVSLVVTPLKDENDDPSDATVTIADSSGSTGPVSVPEQGSELELSLKVSGLDAFGTFTSTLFARQRAVDQALATLTVTRARKTGVLTVADLQTGRATKWWPWSQTSVTLAVTVTNTGNQPVTLDAPVLSQFAVGGDVKFGAEGATATVVEAEAAAGKSQPIVVSPGMPMTIHVRLSGLDNSGAYTGTLTIGGAGVESIEKSIAADVKESALFPAILILAGVLISFFLRSQFGTGRNRIVQQRTDRRLAEEIVQLRKEIPDLTPEDLDVLAWLERRLQELYDDLDLGDVADADDRLNEVHQKLALFPQFVSARRVIEAAEPESLQGPFKQTLAQIVTSYFKKPKPSDSDQSTNAETLSKIPEDVKAKVKEEFKGQLDSFQKLADARSAQIPKIATEVIPKLDSAKRYADAGNTPEAVKSFGAAQRSFAVVLADDLATRVPLATTPPPGFTQQQWSAYRDQVLKGLDEAKGAPTGEEAVGAYNGVWTEYTIRLSRALEDQATQDRKNTTDAGRQSTLDRVIQSCEEAATKAADGDWAAATKAYQAAVDAYAQLVAAVPGRMDGGGGAGAPPVDLSSPAFVPLLAELRDAKAAPDRQARVPATTAGLTARLKRNQKWLTFVVAIAATALGVSFLWGTTETWGGLNAYVAAFLWGLGAHQVTGAAFDVTSFSKTLSEGSSTPSTG